MGVTVHYLCFDPSHYTEPPTFDSLLAAGDIDDGMEVMPQAEHVLYEIDSMLGDNKKWYRNIDVSWAWEFVREELEPARREELDHLFSHMFYQDAEVSCAHEPSWTGEDGESIYDAAFIAHVCQLDKQVWDIWDVVMCLERLGEEHEAFLRAKEAASYPWMFEPEGFDWFVGLWRDLFAHAHRGRPGWHLLQWVWI